jgi:hypothetical protein
MAKYIVQISKSAQKDLVKIHKSGNKSDIERIQGLSKNFQKLHIMELGIQKN